MLAKFSVSNFKGFNNELVFNLQDTNGYEFHPECIKNGIVNNSLVYGYNGTGKSNLGLAIFDIIGHLTDKQKNDSIYKFYLNAKNKLEIATFRYEFKFNSCQVVYEYQKSDYKTLVSESFSINGEELAHFDRNSDNEAIIKFKGAENLKKTLTNKNLSLLKYIKNNSELDRNEVNDCFLSFFTFVESMLFFRSLQENTYLGLEIGGRELSADIIEKGNVEDFEKFLNDAGVEYKLTVVKESEKDVIAVDFNGKTIAFHHIASSGTLSLYLFYYWFQRLREMKVSFLFIDEFDAFYHHELSALVVEKLKELGIQFVLTSHNTSIITNELLRPDCYFLLNNGTICSLSKLTSKELREAHNIEKMYKAGSFNV
ncbi:MAG: ATP-binding protein [Salinivirgaceae bacterium]|nr:ATP-binding protein [Salinivirgaceae bacterium]